MSFINWDRALELAEQSIETMELEEVYDLAKRLKVSSVDYERILEALAAEYYEELQSGSNLYDELD